MPAAPGARWPRRVFADAPPASNDVLVCDYLYDEAAQARMRLHVGRKQKLVILCNGPVVCLAYVSGCAPPGDGEHTENASALRPHRQITRLDILHQTGLGSAS